MKLASLKNGTRDGQLVLVSKDLSSYLAVSDIALTLQALLDDWSVLRVRLNERYQQWQSNPDIATGEFDARQCESPLPRAYQWADGSAYVNHVELVRKARGATMPESFWTDPLMYQGGSDRFIGPCDPIEVASEDWGIDLEAEIAVITDDVPMGVNVKEAGQHLCLLMLVNDVSLRNLIPAELAKGFGFFQSKPASAFSPVAVTPDELGDAWDGCRLHLPLISKVNGVELGRPQAGSDMVFDFPQLVAHAAYTRSLGAGSIIGSGTVSNKDGSVGSSCLAEVRMLEVLQHGEPKTPFLKFGDRVRIEMLDAQGQSIFGAIEQQVVPAGRRSDDENV